MGISTNLRAVETIKSEVLSEVSRLYKLMAVCDDIDGYDDVEETLAAIIAMSYILGKRLGMGYGGIDSKIYELLTLGIDNNHELELEFSDMSELRKHMGKR